MDYRTVLDDFVAKNRELHKYELQDEDWEAIALVASWLKSFRSATTQMSTTKRPMLSWTHAIEDYKTLLQKIFAHSLTTLLGLFVKVFSRPSELLVGEAKTSPCLRSLR